MEEKKEWTRWEKLILNQGISDLISKKSRGNLIFDKKRINAAIQNATSTKWGLNIREKILVVANFWADKPIKELLDFVPVGNPLALTPGQYYGDPIEGGNRKTLFACLEKKYQWYNPVSKTWWYDGVDVKNPKTGAKITVRDDGAGFIPSDGFKHPGEPRMFVAAYRLFLIGFLLGKVYAPIAGEEMVEGSTGGRYIGAIPRLAEAYSLTGNVKYVRAVAILMGRMAEMYPFYIGTRGDGSHPEGMHWGEISTTESFLLINFFKAWDLIFDAITPEIEAWLATEFKSIPPPSGGARTEKFSLKTTVDEMVRYAAQASESDKARYTNSDWKLRWIETQLSIAACTKSPRFLEKILFDGQHSLQTTLFNNFYRDGRYHYDSTSYMNVIIRQFLEIPSYVQGFTDAELFPEPLDLYNDTRMPIEQIMLLNYKLDTGQLLPTFGDTEEATNSGAIHCQDRIAGFPRYDPRMEIPPSTRRNARELFRKYVSGLSRDDLERFRSQLGDFSTLVYAIPISELHSPDWTIESCLLEDSPICYFHVGKNRKTRHDLVFWGQPSAAHKHGDKLGIWFGGGGYHLAASAGNYPFTWVSQKGRAWETHSAACWVALIDGMNQAPSPSKLMWYRDGNLFKLSRMRNDVAYYGSDYDRTVLLIAGPSDGDAYVVDLYHLSNACMYDYNTIGIDAKPLQPGDISFEGDDDGREWESRTGSLAGDDIPLYKCDGFGWMKANYSISTKSSFVFSYDYGGKGLKVHGISIGTEREIILGEGEKGGYEEGKSPWNPHVLWREENDDGDGTKTTFLSVLESISSTYSGETRAFISGTRLRKSLSPGEFPSIDLVITHVDGYVDHVIINLKSAITSFKGGEYPPVSTDALTAFIRQDENAKVMAVEMYGGTFLEYGESTRVNNHGTIKGEILSVNYSLKEVSVALDDCGKGSYEGLCDLMETQVAFIHTEETGQSSPYIIKNPRLSGSTVTFHVDIPIIHAIPDYPTVKTDAVANKRTLMVDDKRMIVDLWPGQKFELHPSKIKHIPFAKKQARTN
ncbi:MAG: hypothetical protein ACTSUE_05595 [Promethearchaeota archaeon]